MNNTILNYGSISICIEGKRKCVEEGTLIKNFIQKLKDFNSDDKNDHEKVNQILIGCTRFLMNVSILRRGKEEIYENKGIEIMFELFILKLFVLLLLFTSFILLSFEFILILLKSFLL